MKKLKDDLFGECEVSIVVRKSMVDSFIEHGYSVTLDRPLTNDELEDLSIRRDFEISEYCFERGCAEFK
jgi:hypothetical protein